MKRTGLAWLALSSVLLMAGNAGGETRPHYGGTVRVQMKETPASLDPLEDYSLSDSAPELSGLLYDTLVTVDENGTVQPGLAAKWQSEFDGKQWQFWMRPGLKFQDGSPLTETEAGESLLEANPKWKVQLVGNSVMITTEEPMPWLPAVLALPRNAVVKKSGGNVVGSGPFRVSE